MRAQRQRFLSRPSRPSSRPSKPSRRQQSLRDRSRDLTLRGAVRLAVHAFFEFTHRSDRANALWSRRERVWLGDQTYLNWAVCDAGIDVPWLVAHACDAPDQPDELSEAIREELLAYWSEQLDSLPSKSTPRWLALP